jgi:hypothetical protein
MIAILETSDPVRLSFLKSILEEADFHPFIFGSGDPYPGSYPSRLMVPDDEADMARRLIAQVESESGA